MDEVMAYQAITSSIYALLASLTSLGVSLLLFHRDADPLIGLFLHLQHHPMQFPHYGVRDEDMPLLDSTLETGEALEHAGLHLQPARPTNRGERLPIAHLFFLFQMFRRSNVYKCQ